MPTEPALAYRPRNDDPPHVFLFFLTVSFFLLAGGLDVGVRSFVAVSPEHIHMACLALAGGLGGCLVFEVKPVVLAAAWLAGLVTLSDLSCIGVRMFGWNISAVATLCFGTSALLAASALAGMRGAQWRAYVAYVRTTGFTGL